MSSKKMPPTPAPPPTEEEMRFGDELAVLPIRNAVLFPGAVAPFDVGREKSVALVEEVLKALKHSSGNYSLILQGLVRIRLSDLTQTTPYLRAKVQRVESPTLEDVEAEALARS